MAGGLQRPLDESSIGLGLAYAGTNRDDVIATLLPVLTDNKNSMEVIGIRALSCGLHILFPSVPPLI